MNEDLWRDYGCGDRRTVRSRVYELAAACNDSASVCRNRGLGCQEMTAWGPMAVYYAVSEYVWWFAEERGGL